MGGKVTTFIYCLGTTNMGGENPPINAMGVLQALTPEFIPSTFSFSVIVGIKGMEVSSNHVLDLIFKDAEGHNLVEAKNISILSEQLQGGDLNLPENERGIMIGLDLRNVVFKKEGLYSTTVMLDGKILGVYDIYAKAKH